MPFVKPKYLSGGTAVFVYSAIAGEKWKGSLENREVPHEQHAPRPHGRRSLKAIRRQRRQGGPAGRDRPLPRPAEGAAVQPEHGVPGSRGPEPLERWPVRPARSGGVAAGQPLSGRPGGRAGPGGPEAGEETPARNGEGGCAPPELRPECPVGSARPGPGAAGPLSGGLSVGVSADRAGAVPLGSSPGRCAGGAAGRAVLRPGRPQGGPGVRRGDGGGLHCPAGPVRGGVERPAGGGQPGGAGAEGGPLGPLPPYG